MWERLLRHLKIFPNFRHVPLTLLSDSYCQARQLRRPFARIDLSLVVRWRIPTWTESFWTWAHIYTCMYTRTYTLDFIRILLPIENAKAILHKRCIMMRRWFVSVGLNSRPNFRDSFLWSREHFTINREKLLQHFYLNTVILWWNYPSSCVPNGKYHMCDQNWNCWLNNMTR